MRTIRSLLAGGLIAAALPTWLACSRAAAPPPLPAAATSVAPAASKPVPAAQTEALSKTPPMAETSPKTPSSAPDASAAGSAAPQSTPPPAASTVAPEPESPPAAPTEPPEVLFSAHYPPEASVSLLNWKKEHHVTGPTFEQRCWELSQGIGSPPAAGLLCLVTNPKPLFTLARIYRQDGTTLREVWSATVFTYMNWLELTPIVGADGQSLELMDRTPWSCQAALSEYYAKKSARVAPPSGELLAPACNKVGKYRYEAGAFRFQPPPPRQEFYF